MGYIKEQKLHYKHHSLDMDNHQARQEETLMEVRVATESLEVTHQPRRSCSCSKCAVALATVMGLVVMALVGGFILHYFLFTPSCNQEAPPPSDTARVNITCKLHKSDEQGRYDIFTANKDATYLIYGWVKLSDVTSEEVYLMQTRDKAKRIIEKKNGDEAEIFFFNKVKLGNNIRISLYFRSDYTDSSFHVYEL